MVDYEESCQAIRHYSSALRDVRTVTIAQGFAVLTAVAYLTGEAKYLLATFAASFGILVTVVLLYLHLIYYGHVRAAVLYTVEIEKDKKGGIWTAIETDRRRRFDNPLTRFMVNKAIYLTFLLSLMMAVGYNVIQLSGTD